MSLSILRRVESRIEQLGSELQERVSKTASWLESTEHLIFEYTQLQLQLSLEEQILEWPSDGERPELTSTFEQLEILEQQRDKSLADEKLKQYFRRKLKKWAKGHLRDFPWRHTRDPYATLIAETMLQQTKADRVAPVFEAFMKRYPNLAALTQASEGELRELLYPLGLSSRGLRLKELAEIVSDRFEGKLPKDETSLLKLPGIGRYTARAICASAYGQSLAVLDTNVARILERFFGLGAQKIKGRDLRLWHLAEAIAPQKRTGKWNLTLIDFGAAVCTAAKPKCEGCPLNGKCVYFASKRG